MIDEEFLVRVLNKLVQKTVNERIRPSAFEIGTVVNINPINIKISDDLTLPEEAIIIGDQFQKFKFTTSHAHVDGTSHSHEIEWDNTLKIGDKVRMLRNTGGQQYFVIGRI